MILMYYWTPKRIKELKEKGYKLRLVKHDPGDEQASERADKQGSEQASDQASDEDASKQR